MSWFGVTVMVISRGCEDVVSTSGKLILAPDSTIAALVTMKMISSTRKISVSGVMLISETIGERARLLRLPSATGLPPEVNGVEDAIRRDRQGGLDALDARLEVVVEDDRENGDAEAERGGDQRLGNAGS